MTTDKPIIIFFHGSGTNADIFRLQARKLHDLLSQHFDLIYLDASIPCPPGPGVLPFFEGCDPYLTWMDDSTPAAEKAFWAGDEMDHLTQQVRQLGNVVGLVGFSMGAKMAMEVARRLEKADAGDGKERTAAGVKIVVCVCGTAPFHGGLSGDIGKGEKDSEREALYREALAKGVVKAASVHWIAARDPWRTESERLVEFFDEGTRKVICARGAHHMPLDDTANGQLAKMVLEAVGR